MSTRKNIYLRVCETVLPMLLSVSRWHWRLRNGYRRARVETPVGGGHPADTNNPADDEPTLYMKGV